MNVLDTFSTKKRREIMRLVHSKDTAPEKKVRSLIHSMGFRFRLHRKDLPGNPDIVLPKYSTVVFVHGCFWHRHRGCQEATTPSTRKNYWLPKFEKTIKRDQKNKKALQKAGWKVIVIWECQIKGLKQLSERLTRELANR